MSFLLRLIKWFILTMVFSSRGTGLNLYPFGSDTGDGTLKVKDDHTSQRISTPEFPFFGRNFTGLHVNENGIIFFGAVSSDKSPSTFPLRDKVYAAAPYWADVFTERGGNIWYRLTSDNVTMYAITRDIKRAFPRYNEFTSSWAVIVTWDGVTFFSATDAYRRQKNTFQVIMTSNGNMSFVAYLYKKLVWTTGTLNGGNQSGLGGKPAKVGFSYGDWYHEIEDSGTKNVLTLTKNTNCGQPGVFFFRVDGAHEIDDQICDSKESISLYPSPKAIQSGNNIRIRGLCYRPQSDFFCDFGEVRIAKAYRLSDSEVMCSVPFITTKMEMVISFYSSKREFHLSKVFILDPVDFTKTYVTLKKYPAAWTPSNRVKIVWDPAELALDQPVTIQIITLVLNPFGIVQARATITVIKEQENTGNAEFNLPYLANESKDERLRRNQLQMVLVESLVNEGYNTYTVKQWIWSDLFLLTNKYAAGKSCLLWKRLQTVNTSQLEGHNSAAPCPKTVRQLLADEGRFTSYDVYHHRDVFSCYLDKIPSSASSDKSRRPECCYDRDGEITRAPTRVVANQTKSQNTAASVFIEFREHFTPYLDCCVFAADTDACSAYNTLGISVNGSSYIPPNIGALFGDPHFITLDGVEYTFNGYGEYTILNVNNAEFLLQGRMQPLPGGQGVKSPATGFTAFAMMQTGSSRIQVQRDKSQPFVLLIDGEQTIIEFGRELQAWGVSIRNTSRGEHLRLVIAFICGITVYIEDAAVLQVAVTVPVEFKGKTKGLLGFWNDNTNEEYLLPNGDFFSTVSTMSQVHHSFGQQWTVTRNESLFTYGPGRNHADYFISGYIPTFMEAYNPVLNKMKAGLRKRALKICEQSFQCVFDIAVTGRVDIGKDTMEFQKWLLKMKRNLQDEGCNAILRLDKGSVQTNITKPGVIAHYFNCNEGYVLFGQNTISCRDGAWDGSAPRCYRASIGCKPLDASLPNGSFHGDGNKFGDRYTFDCDATFVLVGNREVICGKDGVWSGIVPTCKRRNCSQLTVENAHVIAEKDGVLVISCNEGYSLTGPGKINCENGSLNGTFPSCIREKSSTAHARQEAFTTVLIIAVVVSFVALLIIAITICLVCKHRRLNGKEEARAGKIRSAEC
ncbi:protein mesh-like [Acropora palmata]|uniref:protein mesh-like n=1 Tax=Acropora palmata TaxID=6131 RepID=UPI003D9FDCE5